MLACLVFHGFWWLLSLCVMGPVLVCAAWFFFPDMVRGFNLRLTDTTCQRLLDDNHFNQLLWLLRTKRRTIEESSIQRKIFYRYMEAEAYSGIGEFRLAEQSYLRMVELAELSSGEESLEYMGALLSLATFYRRLGDTPKVERLAGQVVRFNQANEEKVPELFRQTALLLWKDSVPRSTSTPLSRRETGKLTRKIRKDYGEEHPFYVDALNREIAFAWQDKDTSRVRELIDGQSRAIRGIINRDFLFMSAHQQTYLYRKYQKELARVYQIQHIAPTAEWAGHCYSDALFLKGLLLRSSHRFRSTLDNLNDTTLQEAYDRWLDRKREISFLATRKGVFSRVKRMIEEEKAERQEKELAAKVLDWREATSLESVDWLDIQRSLSPDEACVEFVAYPLAGENHYAALLLRPDSRNPEFIPLFEEKEMLRLFPVDSLPLRQRIDTLYRTDALYRLVWEPLAARLEDRKRVYYSPSGVLHQLSFPAFMEERFPYALRQVSSTREIKHLKETGKYLIDKAVLFGALRYDAGDSALVNASREAATRTRSGRMPWGPLRYSGYEVYRIKALLDSLHISTDIYTGLRGNEEAFKALDRAETRILHLSTHGYFLREDTSWRNPMLRSGLVLSGANRTWQEKGIIEGIEDGLLTADEISLMRLGHLRLAVLSACETALGTIHDGEGVFGLQRAFKLAGARTLVISLWPVDDRATAEFMISFYRSWLTGKELHEAFEDTRAAFREKYENPYYWAGFVMVD